MPMTPAAATLILAYDNPGHVRRLIGALDGLDIFLHCDAKTPDHVVTEMLGDRRDVSLVPRHSSPRRRWGAVEAELAGLRMVLERSPAEHIIVLSGSCYPLLTVSDLEDDLRAWRGISRLELNPLPWAGWSNSSLIRDGGLHRVDRRFARIGGRLVLFAGYPIPIGRRAVPSDLRLQASSQWKIFARRHAAALLRVLDERADLVRFWRSTYVPQESCLASILASPGVVGSASEQLRHEAAWYIDWRGSERGGHPRWLGLDDFPQLAAARNRRPLLRDDPLSHGPNTRNLFARKMGPASTELVTRIDEELRV